MHLVGSSFAGGHSSLRARRGALALLLAGAAAVLPAAGVLAASSSVSSPEVTTVVSGPNTAQDGVLYPLTITVTNTSARDMIGSGLFVVVPTGTAARVRDIAGATCRIDRNIQGTCQGGPLAAGASTSIVVDIVPLSAGPMTLTGWGSVETAGIVWIGSGSTSITVSVDPAPVAPAPDPVADLGLSGSASTGSPAAGAAFTTRYSVRNSGPVAATRTTLEQRLPAGVAFAGGSASNGGGCAVSGSTVTCDLGTVANGEQVAVTIHLVAPTTPGSSSIGATVSASVPDAKPGNNSTAISLKVK